MNSHPTLTVLSLGGGVQSSVMALMASQGAFDRIPDCAIFADTHWEPPSVYEHIEWLAGQLRFPLHVVDNGRSLREDVKALTNHSGSRSYVDCDDVSGLSRLGSDPLRGWLRCLRYDLSTRSGWPSHAVPTASSSCDLIGAWPHAPSQSCPLTRPAAIFQQEVEMTGVVGHEGSRAVQVIIGVDTHQDRHVAVAIDRQGVRLGERHMPATMFGYGELERWSRGLGEIRAFGIEGTGSYGAGVARFLIGRGYAVVEVNRPDRSTRHRKGKSDPTDAEKAARAVLSGVADATPKSGEGEVEMIRMLKSAKDSAVKACTQAFNQMKALIVTAPPELRETLDGLAAGALMARCKSFRPGHLDGPNAAARYTLRSLACRYLRLGKEVHDLEAELDRLIRKIAPALVSVFGIGPDSAANLLIAAGSNPERLHSEAVFASLCGVNPIPASSGKTNRHRLNRGGDRQANAALYRIVLVRLRHDHRTRAYMRRRTMEGMSKSEVIRCLKRYVAREVFSVLQNSVEIVRRAA